MPALFGQWTHSGFSKSDIGVVRHQSPPGLLHLAVFLMLQTAVSHRCVACFSSGALPPRLCLTPTHRSPSPCPVSLPRQRSPCPAPRRQSPSRAPPQSVASSDPIPTLGPFLAPVQLGLMTDPYSPGGLGVVWGRRRGGMGGGGIREGSAQL